MSSWDVCGPEKLKTLDFPYSGKDRRGRYVELLKKVKQGVGVLLQEDDEKRLLQEINSIRQAATHRGMRVSAYRLKDRDKAYIELAKGKP